MPAVIIIEMLHLLSRITNYTHSHVRYLVQGVIDKPFKDLDEL